jgi:hypothetical protein
MRETCYCGRNGEVEDRVPVATSDGRRALRCPNESCGHLEYLTWLPEIARRPIFGKARRRQAAA